MLTQEQHTMSTHRSRSKVPKSLSSDGNVVTAKENKKKNNNDSGCFKNTMVADSTLKHVLTSMDQRMQQHHQKLLESSSGPSNGEKQAMDSESAEFMTKLLLPLARDKLLMERLRPVVHPVTEEASRVFWKCDEDLLQEDKDQNSSPTKEINDALMKNSDKENDENQEDDEGEEEEWEDDYDLIDTEALHRVQELRHQVIDQAAEIQGLRRKAMAKAAELAGRNVQRLGRGTTAGELADSEQGDENATTAADRELISTKLKQMQTSLSHMTVTMQKTETEVSDSFSKLQETIASLEQANEGKFSQTEKAIVSRDNEGRPPLSQLCRQGEWGQDPTERLASLLSRY